MSVNPIITGGSPLVTTVSHLKWNISNPQNTRKMLKSVIYFLSKNLSKLKRLLILKSLSQQEQANQRSERKTLTFRDLRNFKGLRGLQAKILNFGRFSAIKNDDKTNFCNEKFTNFNLKLNFRIKNFVIAVKM